MNSTDRVYDFIMMFKVKNGGISPTVRQIMRGCGFKSTSPVAYHLNKLVEDGRITMTENKRIRLPHDFYAVSPLAVSGKGKVHSPG